MRLVRSPLSSPARRAFTLLEVLLAAAIGVMLLGALYVAVDLQFRHTQSGRDIVQQSTLARGLINRITTDITPGLPPISPTRYKQLTGQSSGGSSGGGQSGMGSSGGSSGASGASGSSGSGAGSPSGSQAATGSGSASGSASGSGSGSGASVSSSTTAATGPYYFTVQGDSTHLSVYVSRLPREMLTLQAQNQGVDPSQFGSDLRKITYWLPGDGNMGLARHELRLVTSDDAANSPPDDPSLVIAPEVKGLTFAYWDGTQWQDSWDGTTAGSDGVTPIGPPMAVAVTLDLVPPGADSDVRPKTYYHVIPLWTANGATQQDTGASTGTNGTATQPSTSGSP
jgi:prepilin-type N-terminal cleavage/methylation domain-containing protein